MQIKREITYSVVMVCISMFVGYVLIEIVYRVCEHRKLREQLITSILSQVPGNNQGTSVFDVNTGYRYRANMEVGPKISPTPIHYRTNSHGLIARDDFPVTKPAGEYRIGFVGDSFTAGVMSTVRWVDIVEDELNASSEWRHHVNGRHTRCINFGLDGIGTMQFGPVVEYMVRPFDVDLLVVDMLKEDVIRRSYHRGYQDSVSKQQVMEYADRLITKLPWFGFYPEVIAKTLGHYWGMSSHLSYTALGQVFWGDRLYDDPVEAADVSAESIDQILRYYPHAIFLVDPTYKDYTGVKEPVVIRAFAMLLQKRPAVHWVMMTDLMPPPTGPEEIDSWFNVPYDQHKNAHGTEIYGDAVARYFIEDISPNKAEAR